MRTVLHWCLLRRIAAQLCLACQYTPPRQGLRDLCCRYVPVRFVPSILTRYYVHWLPHLFFGDRGVQRGGPTTAGRSPGPSHPASRGARIVGRVGFYTSSRSSRCLKRSRYHVACSAKRAAQRRTYAWVTQEHDIGRLYGSVTKPRRVTLEKRALVVHHVSM